MESIYHAVTIISLLANLLLSVKFYQSSTINKNQLAAIQKEHYEVRRLVEKHH